VLPWMCVSSVFAVFMSLKKKSTCNLTSVLYIYIYIYIYISNSFCICSLIFSACVKRESILVQKCIAFAQDFLHEGPENCFPLMSKQFSAYTFIGKGKPKCMSMVLCYIYINLPKHKNMRYISTLVCLQIYKYMIYVELLD
jgi:hypothetical protein